MSKWFINFFLLLVSVFLLSASIPSEVNSNDPLGEYYSIKDHPKAKGVNLKLKVPKGWEILEGDRPKVVVKFLNGSDVFLITVAEAETFFSKKSAKELLSDDEFTNELISEVNNSNFKFWKLLSKKEVTIDKYPAIEYSIRGRGERVGIEYEIIVKTWYFIYEDKIISLQGSTIDFSNISNKDRLYTLIANSVILPDQYN